MYRVRQFWRTIFVRTDPLDLERGMKLLTPGQADLFLQLQPGERDHALVMVNKLIERGESQPDLLVAAMLHDVGKLRYPLNPFERAVIVLARAINPKLAHRWGSLPPGEWEHLPAWKKPFVVAEQHPAWGAEMARERGASSLTVTLIEAHQDQPRSDIDSLENALLQKLWAVDNDS
jgi:hypothetical protein